MTGFDPIGSAISMGDVAPTPPPPPPRKKKKVYPKKNVDQYDYSFGIIPPNAYQ